LVNQLKEKVNNLTKQNRILAQKAENMEIKTRKKQETNNAGNEGILIEKEKEKKPIEYEMSCLKNGMQEKSKGLEEMINAKKKMITELFSELSSAKNVF
jgi:hypothetical protein